VQVLGAIEGHAMRIAFAILIGIHGLIHLLGPTKAFGWADVPQLRTPISPLGGLFWLLAAILLVGAASGVALGASRWWWLGVPGALLSQLLIAIDARPSSFRSRFARDRDSLLTRPVYPAPIVTEADLTSVPPLMQT
jgi:hypothetical protein